MSIHVSSLNHDAAFVALISDRIRLDPLVILVGQRFKRTSFLVFIKFTDGSAGAAFEVDGDELPVIVGIGQSGKLSIFGQVPSGINIETSGTSGIFWESAIRHLDLVRDDRFMV